MKDKIYQIGKETWNEAICFYKCRKKQKDTGLAILKPEGFKAKISLAIHSLTSQESIIPNLFE